MLQILSLWLEKLKKFLKQTRLKIQETNYRKFLNVHTIGIGVIILVLPLALIASWTRQVFNQHASSNVAKLSFFGIDVIPTALGSNIVNYGVHIKNTGGQVVPSFHYKWIHDGTVYSQSTYPNIMNVGDDIVLQDYFPINLDQTGNLKTTLEVSSLPGTNNTSTFSNNISYYAKAIKVGFYIDSSAYTNYFADQAEDQISTLNAMLDKDPLIPERLRIDKVVVRDGVDQNTNDSSVDLAWGFGTGFYGFGGIDYDFIHKLVLKRILGNSLSMLISPSDIIQVDGAPREIPDKDIYLSNEEQTALENIAGIEKVNPNGQFLSRIPQKYALNVEFVDVNGKFQPGYDDTKVYVYTPKINGNSRIFQNPPSEECTVANNSDNDFNCQLKNSPFGDNISYSSDQNKVLQGVSLLKIVQPDGTIYFDWMHLWEANNFVVNSHFDVHDTYIHNIFLSDDNLYKGNNNSSNSNPPSNSVPTSTPTPTPLPVLPVSSSNNFCSGSDKRCVLLGHHCPSGYSPSDQEYSDCDTCCIKSTPTPLPTPTSVPNVYIQQSNQYTPPPPGSNTCPGYIDDNHGNSQCYCYPVYVNLSNQVCDSNGVASTTVMWNGANCLYCGYTITWTDQDGRHSQNKWLPNDLCNNKTNEVSKFETLSDSIRVNGKTTVSVMPYGTSQATSIDVQACSTNSNSSTNTTNTNSDTNSTNATYHKQINLY